MALRKKVTPCGWRTHQEHRDRGTSLLLQWLGLCVAHARGTGSIPSWGTKIPHAVRCSKKYLKKKKKEEHRGRDSRLLAYFSGRWGAGWRPRVEGSMCAQELSACSLGEGGWSARCPVQCCCRDQVADTDWGHPVPHGNSTSPSRRSTRLGGRTCPWSTSSIQPSRAGSRVRSAQSLFWVL